MTLKIQPYKQTRKVARNSRHLANSILREVNYWNSKQQELPVFD